MATEKFALAEIDRETFEILRAHWERYDIFAGNSPLHVWDYIGGMVNRWAGPANPGQHCRYGALIQEFSEESIWLSWIQGTYPEEWDPVAREMVPNPENWGPGRAVAELEAILGRKLTARRVGRKEWRPGD